ncbi:hypothetical protein H7B90_09235 [Cohnella xylanilytica]|uniref:Uncharacterized protein n=1 Tax=Cohnella xylanilytica TaxID=557555 RepID=A0A841U0B7_9BACL|nr:spore germination protein GerPC [Cohnella xylanilytica]MBB6691581.1 hypothetical protein [Cohnella xylanilytica]
MYDANAYLQSCFYRFEQMIALLEQKQRELEAENQRLREQLFGPILDDFGDRLQTRLKDQLKDHMDSRLDEKLNDHMADLKSASPPNITYKVQELHVSELKGTLNIGLTSTASTEQLRALFEKLKIDPEHIAENLHFSQDPAGREDRER